MKRKIPKTGEDIPVIGMGTSGTFETTDPAAKAALVEVLAAFYGAGATMIDTAPTYGNAEGVTGELVSAGGWLGKTFYASKISGVSGEGARTQFAGTLSDLKTDKVDLMYVHNLRDVPSNLAYLRELKAQGKTRYVGVTHFVEAQHEALAQLVETEEMDFVQFNYSVKDQGAATRLLPLCRDKGVAVVINRPFDDGRLFGQLRERPLPDFAAEIDCTSWAQLMLKFILAQEAVTAVIPATSKARNMIDNLGAGRGRLPDADLARRIGDLFA